MVPSSKAAGEEPLLVTISQGPPSPAQPAIILMVDTDSTLTTGMSLSRYANVACYHAYTLFLFTKSDMKTILMPIVSRIFSISRSSSR